MMDFQNELSQLNAQFRVIQKRLLAKFKDKNPTPLTNLETLLTDSFREITELTHELEVERDNLRRSQIQLACVLNLNIQLLQLTDNKKELKLIENTFSPYIYDLEGQVILSFGNFNFIQNIFYFVEELGRYV